MSAPTVDQFRELGDLVFDTIERLAARIVTLESAHVEKRLAALEQRPQWDYQGVYETGRRYANGQLVTHSGSLWLCREATSARPGDPALPSRAWVLIAKRGKDGKDGRDADR